MEPKSEVYDELTATDRDVFFELKEQVEDLKQGVAVSGNFEEKASEETCEAARVG